MNLKIEALAFEYVLDYEQKRGAKCNKAKKGSGYDLISIRNNKQRHIEVKSSNKPKIHWRWLEPSEYTKLIKDKNFYIYLVTNCLIKPSIIELNRSRILALKPKKIIKYEIKFSSLFKKS